LISGSDGLFTLSEFSRDECNAVEMMGQFNLMNKTKITQIIYLLDFQTLAEHGELQKVHYLAWRALQKRWEVILIHAQ